jgi:hypothetical protein
MDLPQSLLGVWQLEEPVCVEHVVLEVTDCSSTGSEAEQLDTKVVRGELHVCALLRRFVMSVAQLLQT